MAAVSLSILPGFDGFAISDFTVGTLAPNSAGTIELRFSTTDGNSKNVSRKQVIIALEAFRRALEQKDTIITLPTGAAPPPPLV